MTKFLNIFLIIVGVMVFSGYKGIALAAKDLCGGTGGNGEIVSIESNTFTLKLNAMGEKGGENLIINLTSRATIETPTGYATVSDLKIGDRVTLVGDNHNDGTFTADAVVLCDAAQGSRTAQADPVTVRNENPKEYKKVSGIIGGVILLLVSAIWLGITAFLKLKKKQSLVHLLFFTTFYVYLFKVLDYTLLQFQSLLLLQHFVPNLILNGFRDGTNVNFIPLASLTLEDVNTSLLNTLMMIPFGFGLPFITYFRMKKVVIAGLLFSIVIEFLQLVTGFLANTTFRVADINDLVFNTVGVAIGYILFVGFVRIYRHVFRNWKNPISRYIAERPQINSL